jgi:putative zinc finger/helix-turn-helix YgiT family protein
MDPRKIRKITRFRGVDITLDVDAHVCPKCGLEAGTTHSAGAIQRGIADAYRKNVGLLSGGEIRVLREAKAWSQQDLADLMRVGIASIKRWESGLIQSKSMDRALRMHLRGEGCADDYTGNREFSIPRVKVVIRTIERRLGRRVLKKMDKMLFAAKYLWYADMLAFRSLGRSMTGATYAALPYGPQLNNYRDLVDAIIESNDSEAERLSRAEIGVMEQIVRKFPREQMIYDAAHRERVWSETPTGAIIPYSRAFELTEV